MLHKTIPKYVNEKEVSEITGIALATLRNDRFLSKGIPYIKLGKSVRYNLKDVIVLLDKIDFNDAEDSHIVSQVYEDLLLRLGKEHGIAGEFYTPRPIVRLMTKLVNPEIGETVFDPFCGSCGFLVESYKLMMESKNLTVEDYEFLQKETFYA